MTSTDAPAARPAFGVNERIGETFSVLRQRFMTFVILSAVPGILVELASYATGLGTGFEDAVCFHHHTRFGDPADAALFHHDRHDGSGRL